MQVKPDISLRLSKDVVDEYLGHEPAYCITNDLIVYDHGAQIGHKHHCADDEDRASAYEQI